MASYLVSSQEETLAEPTRKQYKSFSEEFNAWRGDNEITDDLVCLYVREYLKGSENIENRLREDFTLKPHKPSSTKTMYSHVKKYIKNHITTYKLKDAVDKRIQSYLDTKEKRTPLKQAPVMTREDIDKFIAIEEKTPAILRDKLIVFIGTTILGRSIEISDLRVEHIKFHEDGFLINIEKRKTERRNSAQTRPVTTHYFGYPLMDKLKEYIAYLPGEGPLWCSIPRGSTPETVRPISATTVAEAIVRLGKLAKIDKRFTSHSMRRTGTTLMAAAGCTTHQIQRMGNWRSATVAERYVDLAKVSLEACAKAITTPTEAVIVDQRSSRVATTNPDAMEETEAMPQAKRPRCGISFFGPVQQVFFVNNMSDIPQNAGFSWFNAFTGETKQTPEIMEANPKL